ISSGGAGKAALEAALAEEYGFNHRIEKLQLSGRTDHAITTDLLQIYGIPDTAESRERLTAAYLGHLPPSLATRQRPGLPGMAALLEQLSQRDDVAVGLLTGNTRAGARVKLGHYGLADYFPFGGFGDTHGTRDDVAREALAAVHRHLPGRVVRERIWV